MIRIWVVKLKKMYYPSVFPRKLIYLKKGYIVMKASPYYDRNGKRIFEGDWLNCYCPTHYRNQVGDRWYQREVYLERRRLIMVEGRNQLDDGVSFTLDEFSRLEYVDVVGNRYEGRWSKQ